MSTHTAGTHKQSVLTTGEGRRKMKCCITTHGDSCSSYVYDWEK